MNAYLSLLFASFVFKIPELCDTVTFLRAFHLWKNWKHLLISNRILRKSISSTALMENLAHIIILYTLRLLGMIVLWLLQWGSEKSLFSVPRFNSTDILFRTPMKKSDSYWVQTFIGIVNKNSWFTDL